MVTYEQLGEMYDAEVVDQDGHKVGGMCQVYLDNGTGSPAWVSVRTGWFGGRKVFCPVSNATVQGGRIQVPYPLAMIKDAPDIPCDGHLTEDEEEQLKELQRALAM